MRRGFSRRTLPVQVLIIGSIFIATFYQDFSLPSGPEEGIVSQVSVLVICSSLFLIGVFICFVRSFHANKYFVLSPQ